MDAFGAFKIILSIVFSAFLIIMIMNFSFSFLDIDESKKKAEKFITFEKVARSVYVNGIPANLTLEKDVLDSIIDYRPPDLITKVGTVNLGYVPLFFRKGARISITRSINDLEWWRYKTVFALPETIIIFIPRENTDAIWNIIEKVTAAFPDTENVQPSIRFGIGCDDTYFFNLLRWKRNIFLANIPHMKTIIDYGRNCESEIEKEKIIIHVASNLAEFDRGIFIVPKGEGWGYVYIKKGSDEKEFVYRNALDIVALALGGESFYKYEKETFLTHLRVAAKLRYEEMDILKNKVENERCKNLYSSFMDILKNIYEFKDEDYDDATKGLLFSGDIERSVVQQRALEEEGCE